jgi:transposase-like protein
MNSKKCIFCNSNNLRKKGFQNNHQVWECKECHKKFQANRKAPPSKEELFYEFAFHKQTLQELKSVHHIRSRDIQLAIDQFTLPTKVHSPRPIHAVKENLCRLHFSVCDW